MAVTCTHAWNLTFPISRTVPWNGGILGCLNRAAADEGADRYKECGEYEGLDRLHELSR